MAWKKTEGKVRRARAWERRAVVVVTAPHLRHRSYDNTVFTLLHVTRVAERRARKKGGEGTTTVLRCCNAVQRRSLPLELWAHNAFSSIPPLMHGVQGSLAITQRTRCFRCSNKARLVGSFSPHYLGYKTRAAGTRQPPLFCIVFCVTQYR